MIIQPIIIWSCDSDKCNEDELLVCSKYGFMDTTVNNSEN